MDEAFARSPASTRPWGLPSASLGEIQAVLDDARVVFDVPRAAISLQHDDGDVTVATSTSHRPMRTPRDASFLTHVRVGEVMEVPDARQDPRFAAHPAVSEFGLVSMAAAPFRGPQGDVLGVIFIGDVKERRLTRRETATLRMMARQIELLLAFDAATHAIGDLCAAPLLGNLVLRSASAERLLAILGQGAAPVAARPGHDVEMLRLLFARRWSHELLRLFRANGTLRFGTILTLLPDLNSRTLSARLKDFEKLGLVRREHHPEIPPRVEYTITPDGLRLLEFAEMMDLSGTGSLADDVAPA